MALVVPNVGEEEMLNRILNIGTPTTGETVHLYTGVTVVDEDTVIGDFTELTTGASGNPVAVAASGWGVVAGEPSVATATQIDFAFTAGTSRVCNGYYVTDSSGEVLWAEEFTDGPYNVPDAGGNIFITPKIELS